MSVDDYAGLTREQLVARLAAAEDALRLFGWSTASFGGTDRQKATYLLWSRWAHLAGGEALDPQRYPHLDDDAVFLLATERDAIRGAALRKIRGED